MSSSWNFKRGLDLSIKEWKSKKWIGFPRWNEKTSADTSKRRRNPNTRLLRVSTWLKRNPKIAWFRMIWRMLHLRSTIQARKTFIEFWYKYRCLALWDQGNIQACNPTSILWTTSTLLILTKPRMSCYQERKGKCLHNWVFWVLKTKAKARKKRINKSERMNLATISLTKERMYTIWGCLDRKISISHHKWMRILGFRKTWKKDRILRWFAAL